MANFSDWSHEDIESAFGAVSHLPAEQQAATHLWMTGSGPDTAREFLEKNPYMGEDRYGTIVGYFPTAAEAWLNGRVTVVERHERIRLAPGGPICWASTRHSRAEG